MQTHPRRRQITERLARNLAVLMGIDFPDNPVGRTWVTSYGGLSVTDLGRGSLEPHPKADQIAVATLHKFGPETKAALVLAGADRLFKSIEPTMREVLAVLGTSDDGRPAAESMRVSAWASLVADAYRAQPALFVAAAQARAVQRAASEGLAPLVATEQTSSRAEFSDAPAQADPATAPATLGILDDLMHKVVAPGSPAAAETMDTEGGGPSAAYLTDSLIARWIRHLVHSADHGITRIDGDDRGHYIDAYLPHRAVLSSFAVDVQGQYPMVEPFGTGDTKELRLEAFDQTNTAHCLRLAPRVPSLAEYTKLPQKSQEALARTAILLMRALRDSNVFSSSAIQDETLQRLATWAGLTTRVLGRNNATSQFARVTHARITVNHLRDNGGEELEAARQILIDAARWARNAAESRALSMGEWVEFVTDNSGMLVATWQDWTRAGRTEQADKLRAELTHDWHSALRLVGIDPTSIDIQNQPESLVGLIDGFVGFQVTSPDIEDRLAALRLGRQVLLPIRRRIAEQRGTDTALRASLQMLLRGACTTLDQTPGNAHGRDLLSDIAGWTKELSGTSMVLALTDRNGEGQPGRHAHVNCLTALAWGELVLAESGQAGPDELTRLERHLDQAVSATLAANSRSRIDELDDSSERVAQLNRLLDGYRDLAGQEVDAPDNQGGEDRSELG
jgi:hypothetical protein